MALCVTVALSESLFVVDDIRTYHKVDEVDQVGWPRSEGTSHLES